MTRTPRTRIVAVRGRKKKLINKWFGTPRVNARILRAHLGHGDKAGTPKIKTGWQPRRRRRKLGGRRRTTLIQAVFKWIKVPTGKVRKRRG